MRILLKYLDILLLGIPALLATFTRGRQINEPLDFIKKTHSEINCPLTDTTGNGKYFCKAYHQINQDKLKSKLNNNDTVLLKPTNMLEFPAPCSMKSAKRCDIYLSYLHTQGYKQ